jgi:hypothetical protein
MFGFSAAIAVEVVAAPTSESVAILFTDFILSGFGFSLITKGLPNALPRSPSVLI